MISGGPHFGGMFSDGWITGGDPAGKRSMFVSIKTSVRQDEDQPALAALKQDCTPEADSAFRD